MAEGVSQINHSRLKKLCHHGLEANPPMAVGLQNLAQLGEVGPGIIMKQYDIVKI